MSPDGREAAASPDEAPGRRTRAPATGTVLHRPSTRPLTAGAARWAAGTSYLQKWLVLGTLIGVMAGLGAIVFYAALLAATHLFLGVLAGYTVPTPAGEGGHGASAWFARPWALPLVVGGGALLGALLVFRFAPEAEGHGTDAAIAAVHHQPRAIRFRVVVVKIVASALTIGSGGSGGREGPTGQISAGFASLLSRELDLSPGDARIAVATGIGSGIGAIFGAPLGGAVLACEVLYRNDFDPGSLLPSFVASTVGYVIFGAYVGYTPLFGFNGSHFTDPVHLVWFVLIGVVGGFVGLLYAKGFYGIADVFARLPAPRWSKPAIGGVLVGCMALVIPEVLGTGYGWIQHGLGPHLSSIPLWIVLVLPFARIVATGLSIGSGGSGGIFGPGMIIGAFIGASVWRLFEPVFPSMGHDPAPYVIVGMMCCFGGISRAPLAVMLMVAEMTGSVSILAPAMIAVGLAWFIVRRGDDTIYRSQLDTRADAPAQRLLLGMPLLANLPVSGTMSPPRLVLPADLPTAAARRRIASAGVGGAPVVDDVGHFDGTVTAAGLASLGAAGDRPVGLFADRSTPTVGTAAHVDAALEALTTAEQSWVPVIDQDRRVVGTIATSDVVRGYRVGLLDSLRQTTGGTGGTGGPDVTVAPGSSLAGRELREAGLPPGVIVTSVQRENDLVIPTGSTRLQPGDRLAVIGRPPDVDRVQALASALPLDGPSGDHRPSPGG